MNSRVYHCTEILSSTNLIVWGGDQDGLPRVHDSDEKRRITTKLDMLDLSTLKWNKISTTGTPPAAVMQCSTTTIGGDMYVFGGRCDDYGKCSHNDLHVLNSSNVWSTVCTVGDRPIAKYGCGLISYTFNGSDYLLTIGGEGPQPPPDHHRQQRHTQYTRDMFTYTNEIHIMNIATGIIVLHVMIVLILFDCI